MKQRKRSQVTGWRNDRTGILAIFADNKKFLMPVIFFIAVLITVVIVFKANRTASEDALAGDNSSVGEVNEIQEITMEECQDQNIVDLVNRYYQAMAD